MHPNAKNVPTGCTQPHGEHTHVIRYMRYATKVELLVSTHMSYATCEWT